MSDAKQVLTDSQGKPSSKRIAGIILLIIGIAYLLAVGVMSIFNPVADPGTALAVGQWITGAGAGLLGIGVFELLGGKNGSNNTGS
jgi:hypothetical protein